MHRDTTRFHLYRLAAAAPVAALAAAGAIAQPVAASADSRPATSAAQKVADLKASAPAARQLDPSALGEFSRDNVYTAVTPCRIVDTRVAGGAFGANTSRTFDVDGATYAAQGGFNGSCNIPFGVPSAVAMTVTVTNTGAPGYITAWGLGTQPLSSVLNFFAGQTTANTSIVPVVPGSGNDFSIFASASADVVIDVVGYFAAPAATALDCTQVSSATTAIPYNAYTSVDAVCPAGRTVTGGGTFPTEGTLGRPNIWTDGYPASSSTWRVWVDNQTGSSRTIQAWAVCCRVPGR